MKKSNFKESANNYLTHTNNPKGITLVALVITIVILLILAGISISALTNTGLFEKAKAAKYKTENAQVEENATLSEYENAINEYLSGTTGSSQIGETLASKVKPGDYVSYTPDTASTDSILTELGTYSGSTENTTSTLTQESSLNWRVLDIKDGKVRLISELPTTSKITLSGAKSYNNAVYLIDKICSTLYNNSTYAEKVQSLKIEDIQDYLTYDYTQYANSNVDTGKYGGTQTYTTNTYYPNLFAKEKTGWVDEVQGTELNLSEQTAPIDETLTQVEKSIKITQTYWDKAMEPTDFIDSIYYNLFINNGSNYNTYWMSSRCVDAYSNYARFRVRRVASGGMGAYSLYNSNDSSYSISYALRPIITLKSDVQIDITDTTKDGTTATNAYVIK